MIAAFSCLGCSGRVVVEKRSPGPVVMEEEVPPGELAKRLGIPPGHLPPPGECRIWLPGVPPGHQPPPGPCPQLARELPAGAWLIQRSDRRPKEIRVAECHRSEPAVIVAVRIYEAETGKYVRDE